MNELFSKNHSYHIFNRGHNSPKIIFNEGNYICFLKNKILTFNGVKILVYCLIPESLALLLQQMTERPKWNFGLTRNLLHVIFLHRMNIVSL